MDNQNQNPNAMFECQTRVQELFGGSFTIEKLPETLRDISDFVPVSDNQEIFSDVNEANPAYSGNQLIVEILENSGKTDTEAIQYNFEDLVETQAAKDANIVAVQHFPNGVQARTVMPQINIAGSQVSVSLLKGTCKIFPTKKTQGQERDFVTMLMCLLRFKAPYNTDLLFTLNIPDKHSDTDEDSELNGEPGQSPKYQEFVKQCEYEMNQLILPSFVVKSDEDLKQLLGM